MRAVVVFRSSTEIVFHDADDEFMQMICSKYESDTALSFSFEMLLLQCFSPLLASQQFLQEEMLESLDCISGDSFGTPLYVFKTVDCEYTFVACDSGTAPVFLRKFVNLAARLCRFLAGPCFNLLKQQNPLAISRRTALRSALRIWSFCVKNGHDQAFLHGSVERLFLNKSIEESLEFYVKRICRTQLFVQYRSAGFVAAHALLFINSKVAAYCAPLRASKSQRISDADVVLLSLVGRGCRALNPSFCCCNLPEELSRLGENIKCCGLLNNRCGLSATNALSERHLQTRRHHSHEVSTAKLRGCISEHAADEDNVRCFADNSACDLLANADVILQKTCDRSNAVDIPFVSFYFYTSGNSANIVTLARPTLFLPLDVAGLAVSTGAGCTKACLVVVFDAVDIPHLPASLALPRNPFSITFCTNLCQAVTLLNELSSFAAREPSLWRPRVHALRAKLKEISAGIDFFSILNERQHNARRVSSSGSMTNMFHCGDQQLRSVSQWFGSSFVPARIISRYRKLAEYFFQPEAPSQTRPNRRQNGGSPTGVAASYSPLWPVAVSSRQNVASKPLLFENHSEARLTASASALSKCLQHIFQVVFLFRPAAGKTPSDAAELAASRSATEEVIGHDLLDVPDSRRLCHSEQLFNEVQHTARRLLTPYYAFLIHKAYNSVSLDSLKCSDQQQNVSLNDKQSSRNWFSPPTLQHFVYIDRSRQIFVAPTLFHSPKKDILDAASCGLENAERNGELRTISGRLHAVEHGILKNYSGDDESSQHLIGPDKCQIMPQKNNAHESLDFFPSACTTNNEAVNMWDATLLLSAVNASVGVVHQRLNAEDFNFMQFSCTSASNSLTSGDIFCSNTLALSPSTRLVCTYRKWYEVSSRAGKRKMMTSTAGGRAACNNTIQEDIYPQPFGYGLLSGDAAQWLIDKHSVGVPARTVRSKELYCWHEVTTPPSISDGLDVDVVAVEVSQTDDSVQQAIEADMKRVRMFVENDLLRDENVHLKSGVEPLDLAISARLLKSSCRRSSDNDIGCGSLCSSVCSLAV